MAVFARVSVSLLAQSTLFVSAQDQEAMGTSAMCKTGTVLLGCSRERRIMLDSKRDDVPRPKIIT